MVDLVIYRKIQSHKTLSIDVIHDHSSNHEYIGMIRLFFFFFIIIIIIILVILVGIDDGDFVNLFLAFDRRHRLLVSTSQSCTFSFSLSLSLPRTRLTYSKSVFSSFAMCDDTQYPSFFPVSQHSLTSILSSPMIFCLCVVGCSFVEDFSFSRLFTWCLYS